MAAADETAADGFLVDELIIATNRRFTGPAETRLKSHQDAQSEVSKAGRSLDRRRLDMTECREALRQFGQRYGAFDDEIAAAVRYWVGKLIEDTVDDAIAVVDVGDFLHALVN